MERGDLCYLDRNFGALQGCDARFLNSYRCFDTCLLLLNSIEIVKGEEIIRNAHVQLKRYRVQVSERKT